MGDLHAAIMNLQPVKFRLEGPIDWYAEGFIAARHAAAELASAALSAPAVPINLNIIRKWPDGFQDRLEHVWLDVVGFIPEVKLRDLQLTLAEFGFTMVVYAAPSPQEQTP